MHCEISSSKTLLLLIDQNNHFDNTWGTGVSYIDNFTTDRQNAAFSLRRLSLVESLKIKSQYP